MKEKEFLKQLNSEQNAFGEHTEEIVKQLLEEGKAIAVRKKSNFLTRLFSRMQKTKSTPQILEENFDLVLSKLFTYGQIEDVLKMLLQNIETINIVNKKWGLILTKITAEEQAKVLKILVENAKTIDIISENIELILAKVTTNEQLTKLLEILLKNPKTIQIVKEHFSDIYRKCNIISKQDVDNLGKVPKEPKEILLDGIKSLPDGKAILLANADTVLQEGVTIADIPAFRGISIELDNKLQQQLENRKEQIVREMLQTSIVYKEEPERKEQCINDYFITVTTMMEELLKRQSVRMIDIKLLGRGGYSRAYQIGEEVLKIGDTRATHEIPNHRRILQPLIRIDLIDEKNDNYKFACVEVANRVDEIPEEEQSKEKLYQIYKELRKDGIIWADAKFQNVGKLRRKNVATLDGKEITSDSSATGLQGNIKGESLQIGEWVIIDTDYIYHENTNENEIKWSRNSYSNTFEKRWLQESQGQTVPKYVDSIERKNTPGSTRTYHEQEER